MLGVGCGDDEPNNPMIIGDGGSTSTGDGDGDGTGGGDGDGDGDVVECATSQTLCGDLCTNTQADPDNCGDCDEACGSGEACFEGECKAFDCSTGQVQCEDTCVDLLRDADHCGDCTTDCGAGQMCSNGTCVTSCPSGQISCNGTCIDPESDEQYCGATLCAEEAGGEGGASGASFDEGAECGSGEVCSAGECTRACREGEVLCGDTCVDPMNDRDFCGATTCEDGGTSGEVCETGEVCSSGSCETSCPAGQLACNGSCIDPDSDERFCGATLCSEQAGSDTPDEGDACASGQLCSDGVCVTTCSAGRIVCDDECVDPLTDREYCGATTCDAAGTKGDVCATGQICVDGACETSCPSGQVDCNGLCIDPDTDETYCGASTCLDDATDGEMCGTSELCNGGTCELTCGDGLIACGDSCVDPLGDPEYCGATDCSMAMGMGVACAVDEACVIGECREFIPEWGVGMRVSKGDAYTVYSDTRIATTSSGVAIGLWRQATVDSTDALVEFASNRVFASVYDPSTKTWGAQQQISSAAVDTRNLGLAMSESGNAIAVWVEGGANVPNKLMAAIFDGSAGTWDAPVRIDNGGANNKIDTPEVAIDASGDALVVWAQGVQAPGELTTAIHRARYVKSTGLFDAAAAFGRASVATFIDNDPPKADEYHPEVFNPRVDVNDNGQAVVLWQEHTADGFEPGWTPAVTMANISDATPSWSAPLDLKAGQNLTGMNNSFDAGIDNGGNVIATYTAYDSSYNQRLYKRRYTGAWGAAHISDIQPAITNRQFSFSRIDVQDDGDAWVAVLVEEYNLSPPFYNVPYTVYAQPYLTASGWGNYVKISADSTRFDYTGPTGPDYRPLPKVASDAQGNTFVSWIRRTPSTSTAEARRYDVSTGAWAPVAVLNSTTLTTGAVSPTLAVSPNGNAFAAWVQAAAGSQQYFVARFD